MAVTPMVSRLSKHLHKTRIQGEADAVEHYILDGYYNFSDTLDRRSLKGLSGVSRENLVGMLEAIPESLGDGGSIICRLLVNSDEPVPVMLNTSPAAIEREVAQYQIPEDDFGEDVRLVPIEDKKILEELLQPLRGDLDLDSATSFIVDDYVHGEIVLSPSQSAEVKNLFGPKTDSQRSLTGLKKRFTGFLSEYTDSEVASLVFRILYQYCAEYHQHGGYDKRDVEFIIKSVSRYDPFSRPVAELEPEAVGCARVLRYVPNLDHSDRELRISLGDLDAPAMNLLRHVGITPEFIANKLDNLRRINNHPKDRRDMENDMIRRMESVSGQFNKLYGCTEGEYAIVPYLMDDCIDIRISKGEVPILLDNQSTGFKWFFDFFLSVICGDGLNPGDIVLMDEPATNLHVRGQAELREVMKRFAVENQVTFVISTHSPFLISCDYLDEVRIVSRGEDGFVRIENNFQAFADEESLDKSVDQLDGVLSALTVGRFVMKDPGTPTVFVEGITDYNYLTAFAKLLGVEGISFLPINGVDNKNLGGKLRKIDRDPVMLVDSDDAGFITKEKYSDKANAGSKITVYTLEDLCDSFVGEYRYSNFDKRPKGEDNNPVRFKGFVLEDLFSEEDRERILKGRKESDFSSIFKSYIGVYGEQVSEETRENFRKVFEGLRREFLA